MKAQNSIKQLEKPYGKNSCQNWTSNKYGKTYISHAQPFYTNLHYSLPHYSTKTNKYMHKCTKDINRKCNYCQNVENKVHLFTECPRIDKISAYYQLQLTKLTGQKYSPQQHLLTLSINEHNKHTIKLILTNNRVNNII